MTQTSLCASFGRLTRPWLPCGGCHWIRASLSVRDFLEIWERDVLNPEMQVALQMTRAQLLRSPAAKRLTL